MSLNTIALLTGLLIAPAWLVWIGHGLRQKSARTHAMFWGAVIGNCIAVLIVCVILFAPPVMWSDGTVRSALIHWSLVIGTIVGALAGAAAGARGASAAAAAAAAAAGADTNRR